MDVFSLAEKSTPTLSQKYAIEQSLLQKEDFHSLVIN